MKRIMNYRGYIIKQVTEMDIKKGDAQDYQLGEFFVFNSDNEIEYDDAGTLELAKEQIDGLKLDKMSKKSSTEINEYNKKNNQVNYDNLNWRDDGDMLDDPSANDYLKGYQINPYEFKQWASKKVSPEKLAAKEVDQMTMLPWYLSDKIVTLWNGADGPLQSFFEAFTLRYDNKMKTEIAKYLGEIGYKVYPVLTDDRPRYANHKKAFRECIAKKDNEGLVKTISHLKMVDPVFANSDGYRQFANEISELKKLGYVVTAEEVAGLLEYYQKIFPKDYAINLTTNFIQKPGDNKNYGVSNETKDFQLSNESLDATENYMSGNADPIGTNKGSGGSFGYDATSYMNSDISVTPNQYESRIGKKKHV